MLFVVIYHCIMKKKGFGLLIEQNIMGTIYRQNDILENRLEKQSLVAALVKGISNKKTF